VNLFEPVNLEALDGMVVFKDFLITGWMFFWMLSTDVLRLKHILFMREYERAEPMTQAEIPAESLAKLILFNDSPLAQIRADKYDLSNVEMKLESIQLNSSPSLIESFARVLNLNARILKVSFTGLFLEHVLPPTLRELISNRTEDFRLLYVTHNPDGPQAAMANFPHWHPQHIMRYVKDSCPNLKQVTMNVLNIA